VRARPERATCRSMSAAHPLHGRVGDGCHLGTRSLCKRPGFCFSPWTCRRAFAPDIAAPRPAAPDATCASVRNVKGSMAIRATVSQPLARSLARLRGPAKAHATRRSADRTGSLFFPMYLPGHRSGVAVAIPARAYRSPLVQNRFRPRCTAVHVARHSAGISTRDVPGTPSTGDHSYE
jgi:hypothetical protein